MRLEDMVEEEVEEASSSEEDEDEHLEDLNEAWELLTVCITVFERLLRKRNKRLSIGDEKEIEDLCIEITAFVNQWESQS